MKARNISFALCIVIFASLISLNQKVQNILLHPGKLFREDEKGKKMSGPYEYYLDYLKRRVPASGVIPPNAMDDAFKFLKEQKLNRSSAGNTITWTEYGPNNIGGRTRAILIDDVNTNNMWAGGVSGGLFKSTNAGDTWQPVNDRNGPCTVASIVKDKLAGNIYYGGGEIGWYSGGGFARGNGIFKSTDGGQSFTQLASTASNSDFYYVNDMDVSPTIADRIYAGTNTGFFVSNDGGNTWTKNYSGKVLEITVNRISGTIYIAVSNSGILRSYSGNSGTFTNITTSVTGGKTYPSVSMASGLISPVDTSYIYVSFATSAGEINKIVKSTDSGATWTQIGDATDIMCNGQCWYDHYIAVSPWNKNTVFVGAVSLYRNTGTPGSWNDVGGMHPDHHIMTFHPANPSIVYDGNDGGVYKSTNGGSTWTEKNTGYNVTQFYAGSLGANSDVVGGTQDNGTLASTSMVQAFYSPWGADGFFTAISRNNTSAYIYEIYYAQLYRSSNKGVTTTFSPEIFDSNIDADNDGTPDENGEFNAPFELDEVTDDFYLATLGGLWYTNGITNFSATPAWKKITLNRPGITAISTAKDAANLKTVFFGTSGGGLYRITNAPNANPGQEVSIRGNIGSSGYVSCIAVDPTNAAHLLVTFSTFAGNHIYETYNALTASPSWTLRDGNLPDVPVNWLIISPIDVTKVFLIATDLGMFLTKDGGTTWEDANSPYVLTYMLRTRLSDNRVLAATHGRGMFLTTLDSASVYGIVGFDTEKFSQQLQLNFYPNPVSDHLTLSYNLSMPSEVQVELFNIDGRLVKEFDLGKLNSGSQKSEFNTQGFASGIYLLRFEARSEGKKITDTKRVVVMR